MSARLPSPKVSRRGLLVGGGAGVGLLVAWGLWPRGYEPNLRAGPGETLFNAFLKIGSDGRVIVAVPHKEVLALSLTDFQAKLNPGGCFIDVKSTFDPKALGEAGYCVWRL